jgi:hypothetical protein
MVLGDINVTISASTVAWYAAIIGTFGGLKALHDLWNDRGRIKIEYRPNMNVKNTRGVYDESKKYFSTEVINKGRRPVRVTHVGAKFFDQKETSLFADSFLEGIDRTLTESHPSTSYLTDQSGMRLKKLWYVYVIDAKGKEYRKYAKELPLIWRAYFRIRKYKNNVKMNRPKFGKLE